MEYPLGLRPWQKDLHSNWKVPLYFIDVGQKAREEGIEVCTSSERLWDAMEMTTAQIEADSRDRVITRQDLVHRVLLEMDWMPGAGNQVNPTILGHDSNQGGATQDQQYICWMAYAVGKQLMDDDDGDLNPRSGRANCHSHHHEEVQNQVPIGTGQKPHDGQVTNIERPIFIEDFDTDLSMMTRWDQAMGADAPVRPEAEGENPDPAAGDNHNETLMVDEKKKDKKKDKKKEDNEDDTGDEKAGVEEKSRLGQISTENEVNKNSVEMRVKIEKENEEMKKIRVKIEKEDEIRKSRKPIEKDELQHCEPKRMLSGGLYAHEPPKEGRFELVASCPRPKSTNLHIKSPPTS